MTFEEAVVKLEEAGEKVRSADTSLEESIDSFEEGMRCYQLCMDMLHTAEQKIEIFKFDEGEDMR